jgi:N6-adenosine-specific RNA methylase IME4
MSLGEIVALPVAALAQPGAHLYLWTTQRHLWEAKRIAEGWGWRVGKVLTWCKEPMGLGQGGAFTNTTEFILFCRRPVGALIKVARQAAGLSTKAVCAAVGAYGKVNHGGAVSNWEADLSYPTAEDWRRLRDVLPGLADQADLAADANRVDTTWWQWPRGPHSVKPAAFLDVVEQVSPEPYVELFARQPRLGWDSWGWGYEGAAS